MTDLTTDFLAAFDIDALTDAAADYSTTDVSVREIDEDTVTVSLCVPDDVDATGLCEHAAWEAPAGWRLRDSGVVGGMSLAGDRGTWAEVYCQYDRA